MNLIENNNNLLPEGSKISYEKKVLKGKIESIKSGVSEADINLITEELNTLLTKLDEKLGELKTNYTNRFEEINKVILNFNKDYNKEIFQGKINDLSFDKTKEYFNSLEAELNNLENEYNEQLCKRIKELEDECEKLNSKIKEYNVFIDKVIACDKDFNNIGIFKKIDEITVDFESKDCTSIAEQIKSKKVDFLNKIDFLVPIMENSYYKLVFGLSRLKKYKEDDFSSAINKANVINSTAFILDNVSVFIEYLSILFYVINKNIGKYQNSCTESLDKAITGYDNSSDEINKKIQKIKDEINNYDIYIYNNKIKYVENKPEYLVGLIQEIASYNNIKNGIIFNGFINVKLEKDGYFYCYGLKEGKRVGLWFARSKEKFKGFFLKEVVEITQLQFCDKLSFCKNDEGEKIFSTFTSNTIKEIINEADVLKKNEKFMLNILKDSCIFFVKNGEYSCYYDITNIMYFVRVKKNKEYYYYMSKDSFEETSSIYCINASTGQYAKEDNNGNPEESFLNEKEYKKNFLKCATS